MTQVTYEMVDRHARREAEFDGNCCFDVMSRLNRERYIARSRVALEAALAVRKPANDAGELIARLRLWITRRENVSLGWVEEAADLIERQDEEIAALTEVIEVKTKLLQEQYEKAEAESKRDLNMYADSLHILTAERAELIEALRPFVYPTDNAIQRAVALDRARALLERLGARELG